MLKIKFVFSVVRARIQLLKEVSQTKGAVKCRRVEIQPGLKFHPRLNFFKLHEHFNHSHFLQEPYLAEF